MIPKKFGLTMIALFIIMVFVFRVLFVELPAININDNSQDFSINNVNQQFSPPSNKTIILRLDGVEGLSYTNLIINLTSNILSRNMSVVLGVIPCKNIDNDAKLRNYLIGLETNSRVELAQLGIDHRPNELQNLTADATHTLINIGYYEFVKLLNVYPYTFIPSNNGFNRSETQVFTGFGFKVLSASEGEYFNDGYIWHIGYTVPTKWFSQPTLTPISQITKSCNAFLNRNNISVILIHPQDYSSDGKTLDPSKYLQFLELLDALQSMNAQTSTFLNLMTY